MKCLVLYITILIFAGSNLFAQLSNKIDSLHITGIIFDKDSLRSLPFSKFTMGDINYLSNEKGQFSMWAKQGDIVKFTHLGFKESSIEISDSLSLKNYLFGVFLSRDTFKLSEVIIIPRYENLLAKSRYMPVNITPESYYGNKNIRQSTNQALTQPAAGMDREMNQRMLMQESTIGTTHKAHISPNQTAGLYSESLIPMMLYLSDKETKVKKTLSIPINAHEQKLLLQLHMEQFKKDPISK